MGNVNLYWVSFCHIAGDCILIKETRVFQWSEWSKCFDIPSAPTPSSGRCNKEVEYGEQIGEYSRPANHPAKGKEFCAQAQELPHVQPDLTNRWFLGIKKHLELLFLCLEGDKGKECKVLEEKRCRSCKVHHPGGGSSSSSTSRCISLSC